MRVVRTLPVTKVMNEPQKTHDLLLQIQAILEANKHEVLKALLPQMTLRDLQGIEEEIDGVEHMAFILSPEVSLDALDRLLCQVGFPDNHKTMPSAVLAKELGALLGKEEVATTIFKAWGVNKRREKIGVEIFIPKEHPEVVQQWISQGIGSHLALRVKSEEAIAKIQEIMKSYKIEIPKFMNHKPMKNAVEKSTVLYFDLKGQNHNFRLEFYYKA